MRPLRLTMTAFGPFAGTENVDFRAALNAGLFGIYGPTGAGKSSIFNAMTFALFGDTARLGKDASSLRSDHAEAATLTEVSFVFELGDKRYHLRRLPDQDRPKTRGEGTTRQAHEAYLFDVTGIALDQITPDAPGTVLAERKVREVDACVLDLLGYGAAQFRQIILLPQGDFERFLTSGTEDRLDILRQLFDVSQYRRLADAFKERAAGARREVEQARLKYIGRLEGEGFDSRDALQLGIDHASATLADMTTQEATARAAADQTAQTLAKAQNLHHAFGTAQTAKARLAQLEQQTDQINTLKSRLATARQAQGLLDVERHANDADRHAATAAQGLAEKVRLAENAKNFATVAAQAYDVLSARAGEIDALKQTGADLMRFGETLKAAAAHKDALTRASQAQTAAQDVLSTAQDQATTLATAQTDAAKQLDRARTDSLTHATLATQRATLLAEQTTARHFETTQTAVAEAQRTLSDATTREATAKDAHAQADHALAQADAALAQVQALVLGQKLHDGAPCPVCGSLEHPTPAIGTPHSAGLTEAFRAAQTTARTAQDSWSKARAALAQEQGVYHERAGLLDGLTPPRRSSVQVDALLSELNGQLARLAAPEAVKPLEDQLHSLTPKLTAATTATQTATDTLARTRTAQALAEQTLTTALASVPDALCAPGALARETARNTQTLCAREDALNSATETARVTREAALEAQKEYEAAQDALTHAKGSQAKAQETLATRLDQAGLTPASFAQHKAGITHIPQDEADIAAHTNGLAQAKGAVLETAQAIKDQTPPDLDHLHECDTAARTSLSQATEAKGKAAAHVTQLEILAQAIASEVARVAAREAETAPLRELAAQFNGENPARLTLEVFAIQAMFDQVLSAANLRLGPMSSGRYQLQREGEDGRGRARRGLGIQVHDQHTGVGRATATLSGGETFIAALALALGLSDIVEANAGSIRLDTIFIDEGFGSLDAEDGSGTLDQVLQTLTDTRGQSRAVGLISHVGLVKEAIPVGFQINKTPRGSHILARGLS